MVAVVLGATALTVVPTGGQADAVEDATARDERGTHLVTVDSTTTLRRAIDAVERMGGDVDETFERALLGLRARREAELAAGAHQDHQVVVLLPERVQALHGPIGEQALLHQPALLEVEDGRAVEEHRGRPQVQLDEDRLGREPRATGRHQDPHAGLLGAAQRGQGGRAQPLAPVEQGAVEVQQEGVAGALHGRSIGLPPVQADPCQ